MTDAWTNGLSRFQAGAVGCKWRMANQSYHFDDFEVVATAHELDTADFDKEVVACRVTATALADLEANVRSFLSDEATSEGRIARWGALTQAIEIIRTKVVASNRPVPAGFERVRFLVMGYPADVKVQALRAGEPALHARLHEALMIWLDLLDRYEDQEVFGDWNPSRIAAEYGYVTQRLAVQKGLSRPRAGVLAGEVAAFAGRHLLPRYDLARAWAMSHQLYRWWTRITLGVVAVLLLAVPVLLRCWRGSSYAHLQRAGLAAGMAFAMLAMAAVVAGPIVVYPYCLRLPAGAVVGMVAVLSTDKITQVTPVWWQILVPAGAFLGYVAFEARQHNAHDVMRRAGGVAALGLLYGVAVATLTLNIVGPSFPVPGSPGEWGWGNVHDLLTVVAFRGSVAVLTGTILQVLWSDRTVASPLDRMAWRKP